MESTAEGWKLHAGKHIRLTSPRSLEKTLIFLIMTFHMIDLYFNKHARYAALEGGHFKVRPCNSNFRRCSGIGLNPPDVLLVVYCKPKAVQSDLFHCPQLPLGNKGIVDASLRISEHKARRIELYYI